MRCKIWLTAQDLADNRWLRPSLIPKSDHRIQFGRLSRRELSALLTKLFRKASTGSVPRAAASVALANGCSLPLAVLIRRFNSV